MVPGNGELLSNRSSREPFRQARKEACQLETSPPLQTAVLGIGPQPKEVYLDLAPALYIYCYSRAISRYLQKRSPINHRVDLLPTTWRSYFVSKDPHYSFCEERARTLQSGNTFRTPAESQSFLIVSSR
jgi:hypothetical protein